jgi:predicted RNA polymerase sigma factor
MPPTDPHQTIETVFRIERARLIGGLARMVRDVGSAEELAQDAAGERARPMAANRSAARRLTAKFRL